MQTGLRGRDLISDLDFSKEEVETVLDVAWDLKMKRAMGVSHASLRDKVLAMLFFFSSTRTRGSFEAGMAQLGGHAAFIESRTTHKHAPLTIEVQCKLGRDFINEGGNTGVEIVVAVVLVELRAVAFCCHRQGIFIRSELGILSFGSPQHTHGQLGIKATGNFTIVELEFGSTSVCRQGP